ncbi:MAG: hypothetical protein QG635_1884 [Bacteroidota bacterium]|nr:hypothetical protein [Bacteroidota bacterium]
MASFFFVNIIGLSQTEEILSISLRGGLSLNKYSSEIYSFQNSPDCGLLKNGRGNTLEMSLYFEYPVFSKFKIALGCVYKDKSGTFAQSQQYTIRNPNNLKQSDITSDNLLLVNLKYFGFSPEIMFNIFKYYDNNEISIAAGCLFLFPIIGEFNQTEKITSPANAAFIIDGKKTQERLIAKGSINSLSSPYTGYKLELSNKLYIGHSLYLMQTGGFDFFPFNVLQGTDWKIHSLIFSFGIRYTFEKNEDIPLPSPDILPIPAQKLTSVKSSLLKPSISLKILDSELEEISGKEYIATAPLINSIFFQKNSSKIPDYYLQEGFQKNKNNTNPLERHKYILKEIAEIASSEQKVEITVSGYTSGETDEPEGNELAKKRAESVRDFLLGMGLNMNQIKIEFCRLPPFVSNPEYLQGIEENRRVDIKLKNEPLQKYVTKQSYTQIMGKLTVRLDAENIIMGENINIIIKNTGDTIKSYLPGIYNIPVLCRFDTSEKEREIILTANYLDIFSNDTISAKNLFYKEERTEPEFSNFEAILRFDYNSSELSNENRELLNQICEFLPAGLDLQICGSADSLGTESRNRELENERAAAAVNYLQNLSGKKFNIKTGKLSGKFQENLPAGRFINRSIRIKASAGR